MDPRKKPLIWHRQFGSTSNAINGNDVQIPLKRLEVTEVTEDPYPGKIPLTPSATMKQGVTSQLLVFILISLIFLPCHNFMGGNWNCLC